MQCSRCTTIVRFLLAFFTVVGAVRRSFELLLLLLLLQFPCSLTVDVEFGDDSLDV